MHSKTIRGLDCKSLRDWCDQWAAIDVYTASLNCTQRTLVLWCCALVLTPTIPTVTKLSIIIVDIMSHRQLLRVVVANVITPASVERHSVAVVKSPTVAPHITQMLFFSSAKQPSNCCTTTTTTFVAVVDPGTLISFLFARCRYLSLSRILLFTI